MTKRPWIIWWSGIFAGHLALGVFGGIVSLTDLIRPQTGLIMLVTIPSVFLTPLLGGLAASYVWRSLSPGIGATTLHTFYLTLVSMVIATVFMREGVICLIMLYPLYFVVVLAGSLLGRMIFKNPTNRVPLVVFPLVALLAAAEITTRQDQVGVVTDEILIQAPPSKVWPRLTSFPSIAAPPDYWLFQLGLPYPQSTTSEGDFVGAKRECIFSGDAVFKEIVTELEPEKVLTFDIVESPPDPELIGHLTPLRGRFTLRDNGDGTTTLTGDTWYSLHVRPLAYFDWWTHQIFRAVHLRVMEDIRKRAEQS